MLQKILYKSARANSLKEMPERSIGCFFLMIESSGKIIFAAVINRVFKSVNFHFLQTGSFNHVY